MSRVKTAFRKWIGTLPVIGPFVDGFVVPPASRSASTYLFFCAGAIFLKFIASESPLGWLLFGALIILPVLLLLIPYVLLILSGLTLYILRFFKKVEVEIPEVLVCSPRNIANTVPDFLFLAWMLLFFFGHAYAPFSRIVLFIWAIYIAVGYMIATMRGIGNVKRRRVALRV